MAQWWAEFNTGGPEIEYFGRFVERGQPALDAGCGTGRLLLPWLRARAQDEEALRRFHRFLEPGGTLFLDNEAPYANRRLWRRWPSADRRHLPTRWNRGETTRTADGSELRLRSRVLAVDPLDQTIWLELWAVKLRSGQRVASERHTLSMRMYFRDELLLLLERVGFVDLDVRGGYAGEEPTAHHDMLVFSARKRRRQPASRGR